MGGARLQALLADILRRLLAGFLFLPPFALRRFAESNPVPKKIIRRLGNWADIKITPILAPKTLRPHRRRAALPTNVGSLPATPEVMKSIT